MAVEQVEKEDSDTPQEGSTALLKKVLTQKEVNKFEVRSDEAGLSQLAFHGGCIVLLSWCTLWARSHSVILLIPSLLALSFVYSFVFMPLHECLHETAFKTKWMNTALGNVAGFLTLRPPTHYKYYHYAHHRFTGIAGKDPELSDSLIDPKLTSWPAYLKYLSGLPFWVDRISTTVRHAVYGPAGIDPVAEFYFRSDRVKELVVAEARLYLAMYAAVALAAAVTGCGHVLLWCWVLPSLLGQPFLRFYLVAEHTGCQQGPDMMSNTRTTITHPLYRKLAWQMPYHSEHHAWPSVPFYQLEKVHEASKAASVKTTKCRPPGKDGYWAVNKGLWADFSKPTKAE